MCTVCTGFSPLVEKTRLLTWKLEYLDEFSELDVRVWHARSTKHMIPEKMMKKLRKYFLDDFKRNLSRKNIFKNKKYNISKIKSKIRNFRKLLKIFDFVFFYYYRKSIFPIFKKCKYWSSKTSFSRWTNIFVRFFSFRKYFLNFFHHFFW